MTPLERLARWKQAGAITDAQYDVISAIERKDLFSVFFELNALLYLGVLSFIAGVGWVIRDYLADLGDIAILSGLSLILIACSYYCFSRARPFSTAQVESPTLAFDYVLYLACLTFGLELGYIESRFELLQSGWDYYLLLSAGVFFVLAYRFDNRLVLSLALSTLGAWFGVRMSHLNFFFYGENLRVLALSYGAVVIGIGVLLYRLNFKRHFTETYLHIGGIVLFVTLVSGVLQTENQLYLLALLALAAIAIGSGIRFNRFAFVVYGVLFGYIGISGELLRNLRLEATATLTYFVVSASLVIVAMIVVARRFGQE